MHAEQQPDNSHAASVGIDDETLVAYLDGELAQPDVLRVEAAVNKDPELKKRLDEMRRAWDLLEELPEPAPNPNFAQSTIEMVTLTTTNPSVRLQEKLASYRMFGYLALTCAAVFFLGILVVRAGQWSEERSTLRLLPLLSDWESIKKVVETSGGGARGSDAESVSDSALAWLKMVAELEGLNTVIGRRSTTGSLPTPVPETNSARREWVRDLDDSGRDRLSANLEDFRNQTAKEIQSAAVRLLEKIEEDPKSSELLEAARNYVVFLNGISSRERVVFQDKPAEERIEELQQRVNRKLVEVYCQSMPEEDREAVRSWMQRAEQEYGPTLRSVAGRSGVASDLSRRLFSGQSEISSADLEQLQMSLSEEAQRTLAKLHDDERERWLIQGFVGAIEPLVGRQTRREFDRAALESAYDRQDPTIKGMLEFRSPSQVQEELGRFGGGRQGGRRGEDFRPSSGGPPGPPPNGSFGGPGGGFGNSEGGFNRPQPR